MKTISKRLLCILLSVFLLLAALPLTVSAAATVIDVHDATELETACNTINQNGGEYTINLTADIPGGHIEINKSDALVTVIGNGHTITASRAAVDVINGAIVNLGDGNTELYLTSDDNNDEPGVVHVYQNSTCNMYDKVTVKDHKGQNYYGGGVTIEGGTFHMYGGTIQNCGIDTGTLCYGGGVAVVSAGSFIMDDGVITGCYAKSDYIDEYDPNHSITAVGGGVLVVGGSTFTMNGGTISNCEATNFGGGVAMVMFDNKADNTDTEWKTYKIGNPQSNVTINDGTITGNKAKYGAGVFASGNQYVFLTAVGTAPPDSGTVSGRGLFINGGEISSNEAGEAGGGVLVDMFKPEAKAQIHNAEITNNTAETGAGIENFGYWTQMDIDGCTIRNNTSESYGGGVMATGNSDGGFTAIKNTTITNNTSGDRGAGVYYDAESEIQLSGANTIQNNNYNGKANNLNVLSLEKPVTVIGDLTGSKIGLSDPTLWDDGKEDYDADAVSTKRLTDGFKANNASLIPAGAFTSDHESWVVDFGYKATEIYKTYKYSAKKYLTEPELTEESLIKKNGNSYYIEYDAEELEGDQLVLKADPIYDVIYDRYVQNYGTPEEKPLYYQGNFIGYLDVFHDTRSDYYIGLIYAGEYNIFIQVGTDVSVIQNYLQYDISFIQCAGNVQKLNGEKTGKLVMKLYSYNPNNDPYVPDFSSSYTELEMEYDEPITSDKTEYYANDIGVVSAKAEVDKSSETEIPHETVLEDYTNEVRLVRADINYHINNDVIDDKYNNNDIFTSYVEDAIGKDVKVGETIESFYLIPEVVPTQQNSCPYIFKGWYYDQDNDNDTRPVVFDTDVYSKDIYAHWITVEDVAEDEADDNELPLGDNGRYGGFDLTGVQIRTESVYDSNFDYEKKPAGMRFVTSLSTDVVEQINAIRPNNIEYGYVAATNEGWIGYHEGKGHKLQYISKTANGIDTSDTATDDNYFDFASNINCTSRQTNTSGVVYEDHRNYNGYLLYTLVITYENVDDTGYDKEVLARPYIHYADANGLERVAYSEYRGVSNTLGGCYTSYNGVN